MINIASFKVLKGYEHWKTVFMDEAFVKRREEAGVKILAKGFDAQNDGLCYTGVGFNGSHPKCHGKKPGKNYGSWCGYVHHANDPFARLI